MKLRVAVCLNEIKMRHCSFSIRQKKKMFYCPRKSVRGYGIHFHFHCTYLKMSELKFKKKEATMNRLIDWKGKNASHNDKDICYLSF